VVIYTCVVEVLHDNKKGERKKETEGNGWSKPMIVKSKNNKQQK